MLEQIKRFLFGEQPNPDLNTIHYQDTPPKVRGGLFQANQRARGDLWFDTSDERYVSHLWNGYEWVEIEPPASEVDMAKL